ncbi:MULTISPECIES: hypothetical protein [unclassified Paenibacillus]|uniref:hypothetical protein n=1 Tax=unclassified Paenibacillus TaxID=185978 RepID=UPI003644874E
MSIRIQLDQTALVQKQLKNELQHGEHHSNHSIHFNHPNHPNISYTCSSLCASLPSPFFEQEGLT